MKRSRPLLLVGTVVPTVAVGAVGYWLLAKTSPEAALSRVWLDVGLAAFLAAIVFALTQAPTQLVHKLVEALRLLSIGNRDRRLDPERFGDLAEVARAYNEVAAALGEGEDPNLGRVQSRRRTRAELEQKAALDESLPDPELPAPGEQAAPSPMKSSPTGDREDEPAWMQEQLADMSAHPEVGPVRKRKKQVEDDPEEPGPDLEERPDDEADGPASGDADSRAVTGSAGAADEKTGTGVGADELIAQDVDPHDEPPDDGAAVDDAAVTDPGGDAEHPASAGAEGSGESGQEPTAQAGPGSEPPRDPLHNAPTIAPVERSGGTEVTDRQDTPGAEEPVDTHLDGFAATVPDSPAPDRFELLYEAFVRAKQEHGESTDELELTSFVSTIREESERLRETHQCRDVRFEVRVQNGEVSLLPRLLR